MKRRHAIASTMTLTLAATLAAAHARADETTDAPAGAWPSVRTGANPAFESLPEGHVAPPPSSKAPAFVAGGARVAGFVVVSAPPEQENAMRRSSMGVSYLFADARRAKAFRDGTPQPEDGTATTCFIEDSGNEETGMQQPPTAATQPPPRDWPSQGEAMHAMQYQLASNTGVVRATRAERLVPDGHGAATLEMTDVWVDARTHGAKLIARGKIGMQRIYVGPNGLEVYAARDGGAAHLVVRAAKSPVEGTAAAAQFVNSRSLVVQLPDGAVASSDCAHTHFVLRAAAGAAQMVTLQSTAFLPTLPGDEPVLGEAALSSPDQVAAMRLQALRKRPFAISVSASRSTSDATPVLSLAAGWRGRELRTGS